MATGAPDHHQVSIIKVQDGTDYNNIQLDEDNRTESIAIGKDGADSVAIKVDSDGVIATKDDDIISKLDDIKDELDILRGATYQGLFSDAYSDGGALSAGQNLLKFSISGKGRLHTGYLME